jgi:hypothetical protein
VESRRETRYPLSATVVFFWKDEDGIAQRAEGITRDMSTRGVFIYSAILPASGAPIELDVRLAPGSRTAETLHIHIRGKVVRFEEHREDPAHSGFAVLGKSTVINTG